VSAVAGKPHEFTIECGWCRREVVSFVAPPAMVEVMANPGHRDERQFWRICHFCYAELIKLVADRATELSQT